jgi:hypothetical protein
MVTDEELEKKGDLTLGISMVLAVIVMHSMVIPALLKIEDEYVVTIPLLFLVGLIGYAVLTLVFYGTMTLAIKLMSRLLSKDHI